MRSTQPSISMACTVLVAALILLAVPSGGARGGRCDGPVVITCMTTALVTSTELLIDGTETTNRQRTARTDNAQRKRLIAAAPDALRQEAARGHGAHLSALAALSGCPAAAHAHFAALLQAHYAQLFAPARTEPARLVGHVDALIAHDAALATACGGSLHVGT